MCFPCFILVLILITGAKGLYSLVGLITPRGLYARYLCSRDALGLKARPSARATIGYLVYNPGDKDFIIDLVVINIVSEDFSK